MAIDYWLGTTDGDWMNNANWSGNHPAADDEVIFDGRCNATDSGEAPDEGMLITESGHVDHSTLDLLHFKESYTLGCASSTEPLCTSPDKLIISGSGTYYIACGLTDDDTDATIATTIINNPAATVYLYSYANDANNICAYTTVYVLAAANVYLAYMTGPAENQGCYVANLYLIPRNNKASNASVIIEKDAYDVDNSLATNIYMRNGTLRTDSMVGTFQLYDGTVNYGSAPVTSTAVSEADLNITTLTMHGGTFNWYPDDSGSDATITAANIFGGTFDASENTVYYSPEIGKIITTLKAYPGAVVNLNNNMGTIDVPILYNYGAELNLDKGIKLDIDPATVYNQP